MRIVEDVKLDYKDVLIVPKRSTLASRNEVNIKRHFKFRNAGNEWYGVPLIAANMDGVGTFEMAYALETHRAMVALTKHYSDVQLIEHFKRDLNSSVYSLGISDKDLNKFDNVYNINGERHMRVCIDVANGYTQAFVEFIKRFRERYPFVVLMAGNVVTPEMTEELILAGVDIVKVGIGPGSVCTTRKMTGIGYPQLSAVIECADAAHGLRGHIIADGGCTVPGDIVKAFAAGADFVMLGSMLAAHDEGGNPPINGNVHFYGMSSKTANDKHFGGLKNYRSSEGRTVELRHRGPVSNTLQEILGGLRSACTYVGASELKELSKRTTFVRCTQTHSAIFENNTIGN